MLVIETLCIMHSSQQDVPLKITVDVFERFFFYQESFTQRCDVFDGPPCIWSNIVKNTRTQEARAEQCKVGVFYLSKNTLYIINICIRYLLYFLNVFGCCQRLPVFYQNFRLIHKTLLRFKSRVPVLTGNIDLSCSRL